jgi:hypothetical protein
MKKKKAKFGRETRARPDHQTNLFKPVKTKKSLSPAMNATTWFMNCLTFSHSGC